MKAKKIAFEKKSKTATKFRSITPTIVQKNKKPLKKLEIPKFAKTHKSLTPIKKKIFFKHNRSQSAAEIEPADLMDFDQLLISEKIKKEILNKYNHLETQVKILKKKELEIGSKMNAMQKRALEINEIKIKKNKFKNQVKEEKENKIKRLNEQKQRIKELRLYEKNRQQTFHEMANQRKKLMTDINKADQNLLRTMLDQTISKQDALNKNKYLKEKQHKEKSRQVIKEAKEKNETQKKMQNKKNYDNNFSATQTLKNKCNELEKMRNEYKNMVKDELIKVSTIEHPINYLNHAYGMEIPRSDCSTLSLGSGAYIHLSPKKKRNLYLSFTPEKSTNWDSKRNRNSKTPILAKKKN